MFRYLIVSNFSNFHSRKKSKKGVKKESLIRCTYYYTGLAKIAEASRKYIILLAALCLHSTWQTACISCCLMQQLETRPASQQYCPNFPTFQLKMTNNGSGGCVSPVTQKPPAYEVPGQTLGMSTFGGPLGLNYLAQVSLFFDTIFSKC